MAEVMTVILQVVMTDPGMDWAYLVLNWAYLYQNVPRYVSGIVEIA